MTAPVREYHRIRVIEVERVNEAGTIPAGRVRMEAAAAAVVSLIFTVACAVTIAAGAPFPVAALLWAAGVAAATVAVRLVREAGRKTTR